MHDVLSMCQELIQCACSHGKKDKTARYKWARGLLDGTASGAMQLIQVPYKLEYLDAFSEKRNSQGLEPRFLIYAGYPTPQGRPDQVLDFPLAEGSEILRLGLALFGAEFGADVWLRGVQYHEDLEGWQFMIRRVKS